MIKRIKVYTPDALNDKSYRFPGNYGVEKFLEIFSGELSYTLFLSPLECVHIQRNDPSSNPSSRISFGNRATMSTQETA